MGFGSKESSRLDEKSCHRKAAWASTSMPDREPCDRQSLNFYGTFRFGGFCFLRRVFDRVFQLTGEIFQSLS